MENNFNIELEEKEAEHSDSGGGGALLAFVLLISCAIHVGLMYSCWDVHFSPLPGEMKADRKWTKQLPKMQVQKMAEDPMMRAINEARPVAAPVVEQEEKRVERLAPVSERSLMPELPSSAASIPTADVAPEPTKPDAAAWQPRQEVATIEPPTISDDRDDQPEFVIPKTERVSNAADIVPAFNLMNKPPAPTAGTADAGGAGNNALKSNSLVAAAEAAEPAIAPPPPTAVPLAANDSGSNLGKPLTINKLSSAEEDTLKKAANAQDAEKAKEAAARLQEAKDRPVPPAPAAASVDEKVVAKEKEAVRTLRDEATIQGSPMEENVNFTLGAFIDPTRPNEKYFHVRVSSRTEKPLPVISKDIVFLLDASGSIGDDRLKYCRREISKALRLLNTGDRFNVIAFRDKFTYAFPDKAWQEVSAKAFEDADNWMSRLTAHGQTDVFRTLRGVLAMPRNPTRPVIALVVTDGDATSGMTRSAEIISRFNELNGGLISVYMYGVKDNANAYLMDMVTRGSRGSWVRHEGGRWRAGDEIPQLAKKFERPVLTDISMLFAASSNAEVYPQLVTHLCEDEVIDIYGKCPANQKELVLSMRGLNCDKVYEGVFRLTFDKAKRLNESTRTEWANRRMHALVAAYTQKPSQSLKSEMHRFAEQYKIQIPYQKEIK